VLHTTMHKQTQITWIRHGTKLETRYAHWGTNLWG
jgi:hypothetical protein